MGEKISGPIPLKGDNKSSITVATKYDPTGRARHLGIRERYVLEAAATKQVKVEYVTTREQTADILTKPLQRDSFITCRIGLGITDI